MKSRSLLLIAALLVAVSILVFVVMESGPVAPPPTLLPPVASATPTPAPILPFIAPPPAPARPVAMGSATPGNVISRPATPPPGPAATAAVPSRAAGPPIADEREHLARVLDQVKLLVQKYRSTFGENPVGTNAEIMKTMMGGNPKQVRIEPDGTDGQRLNAAGELVDPWGTPYFFHQESAQQMEIRSAGPDKVMWTADDQVTR